MTSLRYYAPPLGGGIKRWCCLTSVCLSVAYIGHKSRTKRPRKTKIGTEVAHVTRDSDTTFKVKRSKAGGGILWRLPAYSLLLFASYAAAFSDISLKRSTKVSQCLRRSVLQRCVTFVGQITLTQWRKIINLSYLISLFEKNAYVHCTQNTDFSTLL